MQKRFIALLLVLCMALSLASCGKKAEPEQEKPIITVEKDYTSTQALSVYDMLDAAKQMKELRFRYLLNTLDEQSSQAKSNRIKAEGVSFASTKQASVTLFLEGKQLTTISINGKDCYFDAVTFAETLSALSATLNTQDSAELSSELSKLTERFSAPFVHFELKEDPWTTLDGANAEQVKALFKTLYDTLRADTQAQVTTEDTTCTLTLTGTPLKQALRKLTNHFLTEQKTYETAFTSYLTDNFSSVLDYLGWTGADIVDNRWIDIEELDEDLREDDEDEDDMKDWSVSFVTCGDEQNGYTIDLTRLTDKHLNHYMELRPAAAEPVALPETSIEQSSCTSALAQLVTDWNLYNQYAYGDDDDVTDEYNNDDNEVIRQFLSQQDDDISDVIQTASINGYSNIVSTTLVTEDGHTLAVPIIAKYDSVETGTNESGINDVFLHTDGYAMEYTVILGQDLAQAAQDNAKLYQQNFKEDWEFDITHNATKANLSSNGAVALAGMGYYDSDEEQDVTVVTGALSIPNTTDYMISVDLFVYSKSIEDKEITAIKEVFDSLGVELPIEIVKN